MKKSKIVLESWGSMEWLVDSSLIDGAQISVAKMKLNPLATSPMHKHSNCDEVIHVLSGEAIQRVNDQYISISTGNTVLIPMNSKHQIINNTHSEVVLLISYSEGSRSYELVE